MVLHQPLKIQVLASAVDKDVNALPRQMNIETDAVIVNQCGQYFYQEFPLYLSEGAQEGDAVKKVRCFSMAGRGVGLSRNTALMHAEGDICLFSDEDIVLEHGYETLIQRAYAKYPDADMLIFNVKVCEARRTYWIDKAKRVRWYNYGRYPAYSISGRLESLRRANVHFSLLFGGGARYSNGEDSLFLRDCLKAGLKIYALPVCVGEEVERKSTWFNGYNEKFFTDRGVLYHYLYGKAASLFALRFLIKKKAVMCGDIPFKTALGLMRAGIASQKKHKKE